MRRDILATSVAAAQIVGASTNYLIQAANGSLYLFFIDPIGADVYYRKSTNGGITWGNQLAISGAVTATQLTVWYDRWSGINGDLIHIAWCESVADDISYRNMDTANSDTLSSIKVVFAGASTANGGSLSITCGRDGAVRVAGSIDAGTEDGAWSSVDAGATWTDAIADPSEAATQDQYYLLPGWNADTADIQLIFWDASADEISVKRYDDSANSWAEEVIATGMVDTVATTSYPHLAAFVDLENSQNVVAAWSAKDTAGADLRIWTITDTTITEKTNVILDSVDDQGFVALCKDINTNYWYCIYAGKSDGSDTFASNVGIYYKFSTDGGTTWSEEQKASEGQVNIAWLVTIPRFTGSLVLAYYSNYTIPEIYINRDVGSQRAHYQLGV